MDGWGGNCRQLCLADPGGSAVVLAVISEISGTLNGDAPSSSNCATAKNREKWN
jgi:hypothetical protein